VARPRNPESEANILEAARLLLRERRYSEITLNDIAARAGVAKTTIYRRWPSKAALAADVVREEADLLRGRWRRVVASLIGEAQENDETRAIVRELLGDDVDGAALVELLLA
jgi:AcrR family transcriptional regulator